LKGKGNDNYKNKNKNNYYKTNNRFIPSNTKNINNFEEDKIDKNIPPIP
jgi:hypothetical protein